MAELSLEEWFATHGIPYDKAKAKELDDLGADSVEMLKLIEPDDWASLFANKKPPMRTMNSGMLKEAGTNCYIVKLC